MGTHTHTHTHTHTSLTQGVHETIHTMYMNSLYVPIQRTCICTSIAIHVQYIKHIIKLYSMLVYVYMHEHYVYSTITIILLRKRRKIPSTHILNNATYLQINRQTINYWTCIMFNTYTCIVNVVIVCCCLLLLVPCPFGMEKTELVSNMSKFLAVILESKYAISTSHSHSPIFSYSHSNSTGTVSYQVF